MKLYKITDKDGQTKGKVQWGDNVTHTATGARAKLCTDGVIHCYESALLAVFMDPAHGDYLRLGGLMFEADGDIAVSDGTKAGCKSLITTRRIDVPKVTLTQIVAFGILSAKQVCDDPVWNRWADDWLNGKDRTAEAARGVAW
ncbi:MAG: hypothetical protein ABL951_16235, partial [Alphaproteobacteria bacterium]